MGIKPKDPPHVLQAPSSVRDNPSLASYSNNTLLEKRTKPEQLLLKIALNFVFILLIFFNAVL